MTTPMTRIVSLSVVLVLAVAGAAWPYSTFGPVFVACVTLLAGLPGLLIVWFAEELSATSPFSRGIPRTSPPLLVSAMGWLFLVGLPTLIFIGLQ